MTFALPSNPSSRSPDEVDDLTTEERSLGSFGRRFQRWGDQWVGFWERRRSSPSPRAWSEALDYYAGLYQTKGPDPEAFRRLLSRNGVPTWRNPFPEGEAQHFLYHPDGLVLADLEAILEDLAEGWEKPNAHPLDASGEEEAADILETYWPTMEEALQLRELETSRRERHWSRLSAVCWGMLLLQAKDLSALRERVHEDNLAWATVHAWKVAPWKVWNIDATGVLDSAVRLGVLSNKVKTNLLASTASAFEEKVNAS